VTKSGQTSKTRSFWAIQVSSEQYATFPVLIASNYGFLKLYVVPTCTFAVYLGPLEFFGVENQNGVLPPPPKKIKFEKIHVLQSWRAAGLN
jgi:hypothetical protein